MIPDSLLVERRDGVLTLTLNRPETGNLVDLEMSSAIVEQFRGLDRDVRAVCLRGAGADFCAGRVSPTPAKGSAPPSAEKLRHLVAEPALLMYDAIKSSPVPTIAIVTGRALGVGTALAAVCDIAIASDEATFSIPEMERDIPPTLVMAALCDRVPVKTLAYLVFSRRTLTAREAQDAGLISAVLTAAELQANAQELIDTISASGVVALRACKQFLQLAPAMSPVAASGLASHLAATALSARY
jgi:enoyl-CoA hydratase